MFERFTNDARAVVTSAVGESERRGDRHVGTEHLLLAVIASPNPLTAATITRFGIDLQGARRALDAGDIEALTAVGIDVAELPTPATDLPRHSFGRVRRPRSHRPFTGGAKQALEATLREAIRRGDRRIGTEHLLLALSARTALDPARQLLTAMSADPADLYADLDRRLLNTA